MHNLNCHRLQRLKCDALPSFVAINLSWLRALDHVPNILRNSTFAESEARAAGGIPMGIRRPHPEHIHPADDITAGVDHRCAAAAWAELRGNFDELLSLRPARLHAAPRHSSLREREEAADGMTHHGDTAAHLCIRSQWQRRTAAPSAFNMAMSLVSSSANVARTGNTRPSPVSTIIPS